MQRDRITTPKAISQILMSEVVVVNLETGSYYSVEGAGIDIWRMLEARRPAEEIKNAMNGADKVSEFLRELTVEALIVADEGAHSNGQHANGAHIVRDLSLDPPRLRKFTD